MQRTAMKVLSVVACAQVAQSAYLLSESYVSRDFFSKWTFWSASDPSKGFVEYVNRSAAVEHGLVKATDKGVYIGVDTTGSVGEAGRRSVRIQSEAMYERGLFILALDHMPTGCGTWPAFWMYGEDADHAWPSWGEYDVIEGVHDSNETMTSLHTGANCSQSGVRAGRDFAGRWKPGLGVSADNCDVNARDQWHNQGCSQQGPAASMGRGFNAGGGGTFAAEWDPVAGHFRTWFWPSGAEPQDVADRRPAPDSWRTPYSYFSLDPDVCEPRHFTNMRLVFDITFCGDLGDPTFAQSCGAVSGGMSCKEFVRSRPDALQEAYWSIRSLDVYLPGVAAATTEAPRAPPAPRGPPVPRRRVRRSGTPDGTWTPTIVVIVSFWAALVAVALCIRVWHQAQGERLDVRSIFCQPAKSKAPSLARLVEEDSCFPTTDEVISMESQTQTWPLSEPAAALLDLWARSGGGGEVQLRDPACSPSRGSPPPRQPRDAGQSRERRSMIMSL